MTNLTTVRSSAALPQGFTFNNDVDGIHPRAWIPMLLPARHRKPLQIAAPRQPAAPDAHVHPAPPWLH